jgi:hypothetical protein
MVAYEIYMDQFNRRIFKDRRKKPTPGLSRFTVWGRRRTFRRKEDQRRGGYVDRYNSGLLFILTMFVGLNILDAWFTMIILEDGGWEINPIVHSVITLYGDRFWVWKFCIVSVPLILLCLHNKFKWGMQSILGISFVYIIVILYQIFLIIY